MKHKVITNFKCKESGEYFSSGSFYVSSDYERIRLLVKLGLIIANSDVESLKIEKKQLPTKRNTRKKASE